MIDAEGTVSLQIVHTCRAHRAMAGRLLAEIGLFPGQEFVLVFLAGDDRLPPSQLAQRSGIQAPTMTRMLQRMEAQGLVERHPDPADGRSSLVALTGKGRDVQGRVSAIWARLEAATVDALDDDERRAFARLLEKVQQSLGAEPCG